MYGGDRARKQGEWRGVAEAAPSPRTERAEEEEPEGPLLAEKNIKTYLFISCLSRHVCRAVAGRGGNGVARRGPQRENRFFKRVLFLAIADHVTPNDLG